MKRTILSLLGFSFLAFASLAQIQGDGGLPHSKKISVYKSMDKHVFAQPDIDALRAEDEMIDKTGSGPWRFGYNNEVDLSLTNSGTWTTLPNGGKIWNIRLKCEDARTVNLTFRNLTIPEGNELYVYNVDKSFILGKFTENHLYQGQLGTELVPGEEAIVEYYIAPENLGKSVSLEIYRVTHGYRTADEFMEKAFGNSGNCNMNVNCPDGTAWGDQKRGAVMLVSGSSGFCSGSLINNTLNDGKPYVLTANHCYSDPTSWIFRFNWEAPDCANPASSPTFQSLSGAVLRARRTPSDFCLVEITGGLESGTGPVPTVPASFGAFFNGWNNADAPPTASVSIHHPSGDIKKISFDDNPAVAVQAMGSSEANSSWQVIWDRSTTTEGGSSGSPLFDQNHRIIGQLWGGGASCSNLSAADYYGRVNKSWEPVGSDQTNQLKYWLDPSSTGVEAIDGYDPAGPSAALDAGASSLTGATGTMCTGDVTPQFTLVNFGTDDLTSATITYGYDGVEDQTYNWSGTLAQYGSEVISFPTVSLGGGSHTFSVTVTQANGTTDENAINNATSSSFTVIVDGQAISIDLYLDCYGTETSWEISDGVGTVLYSGSGYSDNDEGLHQTELCLAEGCYNFTLNDAYGDGMAGQSEGWGCTSDGWYEIYQGALLVGELPIADAMFGTQDVREFCVVVNGLDEKSMNFDLNVYPNPTTGNVAITASVEMTKVEVFNLSGQILKTISPKSEVLSLDLGDLSKGVYILYVHTENGVAPRNVVIK